MGVEAGEGFGEGVGCEPQASWVGVPAGEAPGVVEIRFELPPTGRLLFEELGRTLGISKERVRQIEHRALEKLKTSLLKKSVEDDMITAPG